MSYPQADLNSCISTLNCFFVEKAFKDPDKSFKQLKKIAENIPRTKVLENSNNYWRGVCCSLIFRFPDDLEISKINGKKGIVQITSASRFAASNFGVNKRRIAY